MTAGRHRSLGLLVAGALATITACATPPPINESRTGFSFALIGDMPYSDREEIAFDSLIDAINADPSVAFVLHAGDIKAGSEPCTDALIRARYE
jgi:hypothetical protein